MAHSAHWQQMDTPLGLKVNTQSPSSQGFPTFSRPRVIFTLAYRLTYSKVINEDNLSKPYGNLLEILD
jgi:hypothetical protein